MQLVNPVVVSNEMFAVNIAVEDQLEISIDPVSALPLITPVYPDDLAFKGIEVEDEELEIGLKNDRINATRIIRLAEPVYQENLTLGTIPEEALEINYSVDYVEPTPLVEAIAMYDRLNQDIYFEDNEVEISFSLDNKTDDEHVASSGNVETTKEVESKSISQMHALETDLFYLRESVSIAKDIETSRTDYEMLRMALNNPRDLSYEELLFSAALANNPEDKLAIYNQAFIHIDRDWRAFNNAAVTAMNEKDLDIAECYLYQASLISEDNGKIQNNMGVLACYMNDFKKAEEYFTEASHSGVDSDYNLSVVRNMSNTHQNMSDQLQEQIGEHKYYEVLGEAINPVTKP